MKSFRPIYILVVLLSVIAIPLSVWFTGSVEGKSSPVNQTESFLSKKLNLINPESSLPAPGSYELQKIFATPSYQVLDSQGELRPLDIYTKGKITLLTFFYERCSDADGCPYALGLFHAVKSKLEKINAVNDVRLVHISFDPDRDTPIMMAGLEKQMRGKYIPGENVEWNFLTTSSVDDLLPLINEFGQNVDVELNAETGQQTLTYQHVLKVFLIDENGYVRDIYSTYYLDAEILFNDIQTLAQE